MEMTISENSSASMLAATPKRGNKRRERGERRKYITWLNMAKTLLVARWALFFVVPLRPAVLRDDILEDLNWVF